MKQGMVRDMVAEWIAKIDDVDTLLHWYDLCAARCRSLDTRAITSRLVSLEIGHVVRVLDSELWVITDKTFRHEINGRTTYDLELTTLGGKR